MTGGRKPVVPPSLSRIVSPLYQDGTPRPEEDVRADLAKQAASETRKKKAGYARNSHWSVRRVFRAEEITGFRDTLIELLGEEEALQIERGMAFNSRIAASEALRRAHARRVLIDAPKGRGRPKTPKQRLAAMMVSVEAYMGAELRHEEALRRSADKWGNTSGRFADIYKKEAKLPHDGGSDLLRAFFYKIKIEEVDRFIKEFRASEAGE
jgi:hypothetical protein